MPSQDKFLPTLTASLSKTAQNDPPRTVDFVDTMAGVVPIFEHLGGALTFAKSDILAKNHSLTQAAPEHANLKQIVESCKAAGTVTKKDSLARNLHRLRTVVVFMERIMAQLVADLKVSLASAVSTAYGETLSKYHSMVVRGSCNAGFLLLPSRAAFLASVGESEESAKEHVPEFVQAARKVVADVDKLYDCEMPASTAWL